jgi:hypothetical protein
MAKYRTRFEDKPSKEFIAAVEALEKLKPDSMERAFATSMEERTLQYATKGLKQSNGHACLTRLLRKSCNGRNCLLPHGQDHHSLWLKDGEAYLYVYQPYHIDTEGILCLADFVMKYNFRIEILSDKSWYFPSRSLYIGISRKEQQKLRSVPTREPKW